MIVETDRMFYLKRMKAYYEQLPAAPITVKHGSAVMAHLQQQQQEQAAAAARAKAAAAAASSKQDSSAAPKGSLDLASIPLQAFGARSHMEEHMRPLPAPGSRASQAPDAGSAVAEASSSSSSGHASAGADGSSGSDPRRLRRRLSELEDQRRDLVRERGIFSPRVLQLNEEILAVKQQLWDQEEALRQRVILERLERDRAGVKLPKPLGGIGRGSRRGMMAAARAAVAAKVAARVGAQGTGQGRS